ncbi:MAG: hypothetical protein QNJ32_24765 [Xenococcaceae cyanobacterium MO_167.B27]|nr:hypothetical protein [Xenococcaceae cyanobacterium MO_167.B27]
MTKPFITHGNLYFVPILRQRLNFAVLVQRAVDELALDEHDLIAVQLPISVQNSVLKAIKKLPKVSLIITALGQSEQREVFPITPCDGMVEAIRIATEKHMPFKFIDQEIVPGHLIDRYCIDDPNWPDDSFALEKGLEWYLNLIQERLSSPPARFEPMDTWREIYMALQIQQLYPLYQRILVVCNATHVNPIRQLLRKPVLFTDFNGGALPTPNYEIWEPSLPVLLSYLDDIPKLVEVYEQHREQGKAKDFDKKLALLKLLYQLHTSAVDLDFSIRHYQAFTSLLTRMLESAHRISPTLQIVNLACGSCFNKPFQERVFRHLLNYFDQVKVMRVGRVLSTKELVGHIQQVSFGDSHRVYVARNCSHKYQGYELFETSAKDAKGSPDQPPDQSPTKIVKWDRPLGGPARGFLAGMRGEESWTGWPLYERFVDKMQQKAYDLAKGVEVHIKSTQFQGSLQAGIDLRRTLRSYLSPSPKIYVKQYHRKQTKNVDAYEPIVWLFEMELSSEQKYFFSDAGAGDYALIWYYHTEDLLQMYKDEQLKVNYQKTAGMVTFGGRLSGSTIYLEDKLGGEIRKRVPTFDDFYWETDLGYITQKLMDQFSAEDPWWEILLLGAIIYAKESVVCVAPKEFVIPRRVSAFAAVKGITINHTPLSSFDREEKRKLKGFYQLEFKRVRPPDCNDPKYQAYLIERFGKVMKQFWE